MGSLEDSESLKKLRHRSLERDLANRIDTCSCWKPIQADTEVRSLVHRRSSWTYRSDWRRPNGSNRIDVDNRRLAEWRHNRLISLHFTYNLREIFTYLCRLQFSASRAVYVDWILARKCEDSSFVVEQQPIGTQFFFWHSVSTFDVGIALSSNCITCILLFTHSTVISWLNWSSWTIGRCYEKQETIFIDQSE